MRGDERRRHIRIFLPGGQVRLSTGPLMALVGKIRNISVGGMKIACEARLAVGETIRLEFSLPDGVRFQCAATIVYAEKDASNGKQLLYGTQFLDLSPRDTGILGDFIMRMKEEQDKTSG